MKPFFKWLIVSNSSKKSHNYKTIHRSYEHTIQNIIFTWASPVEAFFVYNNDDNLHAPLTI